MPGSPWTEKEIDMLRKLSDAGYTLTEITASGVFKGRNRHAIGSKASNLGISLTRKTQGVDEDKFRQMMKDAGRTKCI